MPDTPSITIVKSFEYRSTAEEFSNTYHFSGSTPTTKAEWLTLADAIIAAEKLTVNGDVTFVKAYGYVAGNEDSVAQIAYGPGLDGAIVAGTWGALGTKMPGDMAGTTRWYTGASVNGKKIYCRKYWHGVWAETADADQLNSAQKARFDTFAAKLIDGTLPGTFRYCGPQGASLSLPLTSSWITTRTLKRRGKRPPTSGSSA